ncbi:MAG: hypothetical protein PHT94_04165 [Candidatus Nanoarchaeia archaeon]|nr:hypothetical protein [Candidatus Nanoarchaeia archaeon]
MDKPIYTNQLLSEMYSNIQNAAKEDYNIEEYRQRMHTAEKIRSSPEDLELLYRKNKTLRGLGLNQETQKILSTIFEYSLREMSTQEIETRLIEETIQQNLFFKNQNIESMLTEESFEDLIERDDYDFIKIRYRFPEK